MNWHRKLRIVEARNDYAAAEDFRKVFADEAANLYLLALLLTADETKAEQTFVAGLEDSVNSNGVFRDWACSWAKGAIIKNAIAAVQPRPKTTKSASQSSSTDGKEIPAFASKKAEVGCVLALGDFERFVFVMSVLERYSEKDCSLLLNCSLVAVHSARLRAFQQLTALSSSRKAAHGLKLISTVIEDINEETK
jgi:DNA-directed RNA polymerase specialized sigma24 family protein